MNKKGKLIVIEGINGTGKNTQAKRLMERLKAESISHQAISFPQYGQPSAVDIEKYLRKEYGTPKEVGPYRASEFFAKDRAAAVPQMKEWIDAGYVIIADRYLISNVGHQGGKIVDSSERRKFVEWLYDLEFHQLGVLKPDLNILLTLPIEIAERRIEQKEARAYLGNQRGAKDAEEADPDHQQNAQDAYLWVARRYPEEFAVIECAPGGRELTVDEIHEQIWGVVKKVLDN